MIVITFVHNDDGTKAREVGPQIKEMLEATKFDFPVDALNEEQRQDYERKMAAGGLNYEYRHNSDSFGMMGRPTFEHAVIEFAPPRLRPENVTPEEYVMIGFAAIYDIAMVVVKKIPVFVIHNRPDGTIKTTFYLSEEMRRASLKYDFEDEIEQDLSTNSETTE